MRRTAVRRAAHPQRNDTRHAAHAGAAGTRLRILSRKARSCRCFAHFLHSNDTFCAFLRQKRPRNADIRVLLRESMPMSCHEKTEKFSKVRPNRPTQAIRYPVDTLSIPDFRKIRSHFASQSGRFSAKMRTESAPLLRVPARLLPTRRPTPQLTLTLTSTLIPARAGDVARDEALYPPVKPDASNLATVQSPAGTRAQQQRKQEGICRPCDGAHAMLARRARRPSQRRREILYCHSNPPIWDALFHSLRIESTRRPISSGNAA